MRGCCPRVLREHLAELLGGIEEIIRIAALHLLVHTGFLGFRLGLVQLVERFAAAPIAFFGVNRPAAGSKTKSLSIRA